MEKEKLKILSLFTGIGAFEKALKNLKIEYELIGFSDIDKYAIKSYCAIHNVDERLNLGDITKIQREQLPRFIDMITHGSPCQDFSIAGKQAGAEKNSGTRSSLMWNTVDIVEWCLPKYVIWENVKNLLSKKHKHNFDSYIEIMNKLGYNSYYQVLNAKDYGVPQNRERVYTISIRKDIDDKSFKFPEKEKLKLRLKDVLEDVVSEKYYLKDYQIENILNSTFIQNQRRIQNKDYCDTLCARDWKDPKCVQVCNLQGGKWDKINESCRRVYSESGISPTVHTCQGGNTEPKVLVKNATKKGYDEAVEGDSINLQYPNSKTRRGRVGHQVSQTLMATDNIGVIESLNMENNQSKIITHNISKKVKVRKYKVDVEKLKETLRDAKIKQDVSNEQLETTFDIPITTIEHWFRKDDSFSIPIPEIWLELKRILHIETDEFDESIMTFEEREGTYEKANRIYDENGIAPTLTQQEEKIVERTPLKFLNRNQKNIEGDYAFCVDSSNTGGIKEIKVIGNYSPSNHEASRIVDNEGIAPTVKENHGTITATNIDV